MASSHDEEEKKRKLQCDGEKHGLLLKFIDVNVIEKPCKGDTLVEAALKVLNTGDPWRKADFGDLAAKLWFEGCFSQAYDCHKDLLVPDRPARLATVQLVAPQHMPKLGRAGNLQSRQAILHSLTHTENWAVDLSWDIIARFGKQEAMPREFFDDFVRVAQDEGRHFRLLSARLEELGSFYGAFPAHDGLWDSAEATSKDLLARLAVEHCVHEARGLDVLPTIMSRFRKGGDDGSADLLETVVYPEEITHCAAGLRWFKYICLRSCMNSCVAINMDSECVKLEELDISQSNDSDSAYKPRKELSSHKHSIDGSVEPGCACSRNSAVSGANDIPADVIDKFHSVVRKYFRGPLKPPFNEKARQAAGFGSEWYFPLASNGIGSI